VNGRRKTVRGAGGIITQLRQVCVDYASAVNPREITVDEIRFFYVPLIEGLCERQKVKVGKNGK
jgi:hypothetical protein